MESDSSSIKITNASIRETLLEEDQTQITSRTKKKKLKLIITLILTFTLIIATVITVLTIMKRDYESNSPLNNPANSIRSVCELTQYPLQCFTSLSTLIDNDNNTSLPSETNPSQIFALSLRIAIEELGKLTTCLSESTESSTQSLSQCQQLFNNSASQLNRSLTTMNVDPYDEFSFTSVQNLRQLMGLRLYREWRKIEACLDKLKYRYGFSTKKASNSLTILDNIDRVYEIFYPISEIESVEASFLSDVQFFDTICIFGVQYFLIFILYCMFFRLG